MLSPKAYHSGEREMQRRAGVEAHMSSVGPRALRNYLLPQHREFFPILPSIFLAAEALDGRLWATALYGTPGFVSSPSETQLRIAASTVAGDPLHNELKKGQPFGLLGLAFWNRRRNRANGSIETAFDHHTDTPSLLLRVEQSFGNCPKYIHPRKVAETPPKVTQMDSEKDGGRVERDVLNLEMKQLIAAADTLFIASRSGHDAVTETQSGGSLDMSHRGGEAGFVRVLDEKTLAIPDYVGNNFFNTLGNITTDPETALLFIDFECGAHLYLNGTAEILWAEDDSLPIDGHARNIRFNVRNAKWLPKASPYRWQSI